MAVQALNDRIIVRTVTSMTTNDPAKMAPSKGVVVSAGGDVTSLSTGETIYFDSSTAQCLWHEGSQQDIYIIKKVDLIGKETS